MLRGIFGTTGQCVVWCGKCCSSACLFAGATLGAIAAYLSAPFIVESLGWPAVFTVYGMIGFAWVVLWSVLVSERPAQQQALLRQEGKGQSGEPARIPYRAFATCLPLWAIILVETSHGEPLVLVVSHLRACFKMSWILCCARAVAGI